MDGRAYAVLSSATTYWAETAYTVEQYVAHVNAEDDVIVLDSDLLLCQVFDLDMDDETVDPLPTPPTPTPSAMPSTLELESEWNALNWHRVEYHWFQMQKGDPQRTRMDVSFMKVLWEGMKFPERKVYNSDQVQRLARTTAAMAHFRKTRWLLHAIPDSIPRPTRGVPHELNDTTTPSNSSRRDQQPIRDYAVKKKQPRSPPLVVY
ncbi:unnamed protein product [Aphanomyces euteiches]|uniref:Uncharacterized protein n=1 Tax=Aphanomyces euteiches TaxID=100861 RepID=A0A6G0WHX9_9STRA|nr:hypothetical protein Ae201684_015054 [Aphanomyces euteiches]KAH9062886.1 hypothetical protein Ae201684P_009152 [Aphanomyces euteiches]KAH9115669.1 hypothetical protein AeMF1_010313 [Aphanomyces euteiches]KAH9118333.1 hypothetical protein LEN26_012174 [Aphanomyces euteiches]KAH9138309.1 hypothetical protein LEN26_005355 [Aphanomyces euteiches]